MAARHVEVGAGEDLLDQFQESVVAVAQYLPSGDVVVQTFGRVSVSIHVEVRLNSFALTTESQHSKSSLSSYHYFFLNPDQVVITTC